MSRSLHTTPPPLRARRRVHAPYAPRVQGERRREQACVRLLKEMGHSALSVDGPHLAERPVQGLRISARHPRAEHHHALTLADVRRALAFFGPHCYYGLESIGLVQGGHSVPGAPIVLGRLLVPGRIVLYDHPLSPWSLPGRLDPATRQRLEQAGAYVEETGLGLQTVVSWPAATLRDFILFDVLMHEIGHHMIQQYTGKYRARVMRTRDHEAVADRFAAHCRRVYRPEECPL